MPEPAERTVRAPRPVIVSAPAKSGYVAGRIMTFNGVEYQPGDVVPDADTAVRLETLLARNYLKRA